MEKLEEKDVLLGSKTTSAEVRFIAIMKETAEEIELCKTNEGMLDTILSIARSMEPSGGYIDKLLVYKDNELVQETMLRPKTLIRRK